MPEGEQQCTLCEGTGERWAAIKTVYGQEAALESKRQEDGSGVGEPVIAFHNGEALRQMEGAGSITGARSESGKQIFRSKSGTAIRAQKCWACMGTGKASSMATSMERHPGGESKQAQGEGDEDEECEICWADPPEFGISTSCTHFFCGVCIRGHLEQVMNSGSFPAFCPLCQAAAPKGETPHYGRINGEAMTFLQRKGVVSKEFQFRFMRQQDEHEELFFECPAKCGNYLVDAKPTFVLRDNDEVGMNVKRCPCGVGVCVQCHALVPDADFETHRCPETDETRAQDDQAGLPHRCLCPCPLSSLPPERLHPLHPPSTLTRFALHRRILTFLVVFYFPSHQSDQTRMCASGTTTMRQFSSECMSVVVGGGRRPDRRQCG